MGWIETKSDFFNSYFVPKLDFLSQLSIETLTGYEKLNSESNTLWSKFFFRNWHAEKFSVRNLTCSKNFNAKSDTLLGFSFKIWLQKKNPSEKAHFKNGNNKQILSLLRKKENQNKILFQSIIDFKIWFSQKQLIRSVARLKRLHTESVVFKYFISETNTWKNFYLRTWQLDKLSFQYLTCFKSFTSKTQFFGNLTSKSFILEFKKNAESVVSRVKMNQNVIFTTHKNLKSRFFQFKFNYKYRT